MDELPDRSRPQEAADAGGKALWRTLRDKRLAGLKFRRQCLIGPFVADFCCWEIRLVVELDGEIHAEPQQAARDRERDAFLRGSGFTILRFPNERVFGDAAGVIGEILALARRKKWI
ncbi:MAG TPA: endonuclease domain-containing protein [Thermoanaerobaculia bacterium]|nr:endonuclease domain-containing protein [Thermoanaerobaculia bacterium]